MKWGKIEGKSLKSAPHEVFLHKILIIKIYDTRRQYLRRYKRKRTDNTGVLSGMEREESIATKI